MKAGRHSKYRNEADGNVPYLAVFLMSEGHAAQQSALLMRAAPHSLGTLTAANLALAKLQLIYLLGNNAKMRRTTP